MKRKDSRAHVFALTRYEAGLLARAARGESVGASGCNGLWIARQKVLTQAQWERDQLRYGVTSLATARGHERMPGTK